MRILGVDPGLTRCGVGIIDLGANRELTLVDVRVLQTSPNLELAERLGQIKARLAAVIDEFAPDHIAIERVFAQHNLRTVMGTAQASAIALVEAYERGLPVELHTPSEVKAAVTGNGRANKVQVANMVIRILNMGEQKLLPDATDALALAVCNAWRSGVPRSGTVALTPAQQRWRDTERQARKK